MIDYRNEVCGDCQKFTGEECDGNENEGSERYSDSPACWEFVMKDINLV